MVEELKKVEGNIIGVITDNFSIPNYNGLAIDDIITYKKEDTMRITLLNIKSTNNLSTKNISKLQLAKNINEKYIVLYDFFKGLNNKELQYYKRLFLKITKNYNKKIILVSKNLDSLIDVCDMFVIYDRKIVYKTSDVFDDKLYNYVSMPNIVKFIKLANKKGAQLLPTLDINELIKDIYRRLNAGKDII